MKLILFEYKCETCQTSFKAPDIPAYSYGEFLLRSYKEQDLRYLNAIESVEYSEVDEELKINDETCKLDDLKRSDVLQGIFGAVVCDPSITGESFHIGLRPFCQRCGSDKISSWQITDPVEFLEMEVKPVTCSNWNKLKLAEKKSKISDAAKIFLNK